MRIQFDCSGCIYRQIELLARQLYADDENRWRFSDALLKLFLEIRPTGICPPQLAEKVFAMVAEASGVDDPFRAEKEKSTLLAQQIYKKYEHADLSFDETLLLAIAGNVIDYGVNPDFKIDEAEKLIDEACKEPYDRAAARDLQRRMDEADSIFYILDNCGEAVLDALLLRRYRDKITLGVRGGAILNDVTRAELAPSGLGDYPVVDTNRRSPGAPLADVGAEFLEHLNTSSLVIAKGQGNLESLCPDFTARPIYHLLRLKCRVVADFLHQPLGTIAIYGRNLDL